MYQSHKVSSSIYIANTKKLIWIALIVSQLFSTSQAQEEPYWWKEYELQPGFIEALTQFKLTPQLMNSNPQETIEKSNDTQEPLYWLRRTLQQYSKIEQSTYNVPTTEIHANGKNRTAMGGRYGFFTTDIFLNPSDSVDITRVSSNPQVTCSAWTGTDFNLENNAARDWKVTGWGSQVDIPFTVTAAAQ